MHIFYLPVFTFVVLFLTDFALCLPANPDAPAANQPAPPEGVQGAHEPPKRVGAAEQKDVDFPANAPVPNPDAQPKDFPLPVGAGSPEKGALATVQVDQPELHKDQRPEEPPAPNSADAKQGEVVKLRFEDAGQEQPHAGDKDVLGNGHPAVGNQQPQQNLVDQEELEIQENDMADALKKADQLAHVDPIKAMDVDVDAIRANDQPLVQNWQKPELPRDNPIADTRTWNLSGWSMEYVVMALCLMIIAILLVWRRFWYTVCTSCGSKTYTSSGTTDHYKVAYKPL